MSKTTPVLRALRAARNYHQQRIRRNEFGQLIQSILRSHIGPMPIFEQQDHWSTQGGHREDRRQRLQYRQPQISTIRVLRHGMGIAVQREKMQTDRDVRF
jgi:hypothetical protein